MIVLGINAYHADVSAVLIRDGELIAAVEEERFRRIKHIAGFPRESIRACLEMAGAAPQDVDHVGVSRNPRAHLLRKGLFALSHRPKGEMLKDRASNYRQVARVPESVADSLGLRDGDRRP
ncbi:MAG: carbamoyltransferase N-terminal domain-containing protein, partial [Vicinamibacterales bacterium]